jgi:tRNA G18 (ribose-2'-O)-methylase SpoU
VLPSEFRRNIEHDDPACCTFELTSQLLSLNFLLISDATDSRLSDFRNVPDPDLLRGHRIFVAEGRLVVRRLLTESPYATRSVMVTEPAHAALADVLRARPELPVYIVSPAVMKEVSGFNIHRGCLAIGERPHPMAWQQAVGDARTVVLLERVGNADNVGGIFRNAAAFGAGAVILDEASADPLYRKAIRTSMAAALVVPFARVTSAALALQELRRAGFATVALTPAAPASTIRSTMDALGARPVVVALGHEGEGLTPAALEACEFHARIPISSTVDSLNVAAAAAIALYECRRRIV